MVKSTRRKTKSSLTESESEKPPFKFGDPPDLITQNLDFLTGFYNQDKKFNEIENFIDKPETVLNNKIENVSSPIPRKRRKQPDEDANQNSQINILPQLQLLTAQINEITNTLNYHTTLIKNLKNEFNEELIKIKDHLESFSRNKIKNDLSTKNKILSVIFKSCAQSDEKYVPLLKDCLMKLNIDELFNFLTNLDSLSITDIFLAIKAKGMIINS